MAFRGIQTTNIISTDVGLTDPLLILNKDGSTATDVGFLGKIGATSYAGLVKDSATNEFLLLGSVTLSPNTVNDVSALDASIVKGNITVGTLTADSITSASIPTDVSDLTDTTNLLTGAAYTDASVASYLGGNLDTHILPDTNNTYDIGSASFKIRDLYVSDNSIHIGDNTLRTSGNNLLLNGEDVMDYANFKNKPTTIAGYGITDGYTDSDADARVSVALSNTVSLTGSLIGNVTGRLYGDVHGDVTSPTSLEPIITTGPVRDTLTIHDAHIDKIKAPGTSGATILDTSGATTLSGHNVHLTGSLYGDIGDTLANNPVLTVGTGNNDSQLAVTVASIGTLTATTITSASIPTDVSDLTDTTSLLTDTNTTYTNVSEFTNDSGYITSVPAQTFSSLTGTPTTIAGYGITDGYTDSDADARIDNWVGLAPTGLDTLVELSTALGDDINFSTTVTNSIATKLPLAGGTITGALVTQGILTLDGVTSNNASDLLKLKFDNSPADTGIVFTDLDSTVKNRISMDSGNTNDMTISATTDMRFHTNSSTTANERMRITSAGNVGIGTASVSKTLSVHSTTGSAGTPNGLYLYNEVHGSDSQIYMYAENNSGSNKGANIKLDPDAETFSLIGTGGQTAITIDSSGNSTFNGSISSADKTISLSDPTTTSNPSAVGHLWINSASGETYVCTDVTSNANVWFNTGEGLDTYGADILIVAGGGGGGTGGGEGGGGGAGGMLEYTSSQLTPGTSYTVTVGAGGPGASNYEDKTGNGGDSSVSGLTVAIGGGLGGTYPGQSTGGNGINGGSGGGGGANYSGSDYGHAGGSGTAGQGNDGADGLWDALFLGGGGGGKGAAGNQGSGSTGGNGGVGKANSITGTSTYYAGGGGGNSNGGPDGTGGNGGGGNNGANGTVNTGGGGGAKSFNGASGIVILRVPTANYSGTTTGSPTVTTDGTAKVIKFTGSGTYTA